MNILRFKRAIEIIEATPDNQVNLNFWQNARVSTDPAKRYISSNAAATCGTIACAAGWLSLDPEMQSQGLYSGFGGEPRYKENHSYYNSFEALGRFFNIPECDAELLFGPRSTFELVGEIADWTDKQIWLRRAKTFLSGYEGEI